MKTFVVYVMNREKKEKSVKIMLRKLVEIMFLANDDKENVIVFISKFINYVKCCMLYVHEYVICYFPVLIAITFFLF